MNKLIMLRLIAEQEKRYRFKVSLPLPVVTYIIFILPDRKL
jgi:hypothetical protein